MKENSILEYCSTMELVLSCVCCGSTKFKRTEQPCYNIEGKSYLLHEDKKDAMVICEKCGLEDYVENLVIQYR